MTTSFTLSRADFVRLENVLARRLRQNHKAYAFQYALRVVVWFTIGLAGAMYVSIMHDFPKMAGPLREVAYLLAFALIVVVIMPYVSKAAARKHMLAPNGAFLSPQSVTLSAESLTVSSALGHVVVPWSGMLGRDEDDANYYLFVDATEAFVLPRAAIGNRAADFERYTVHLKKSA